MTIKFLGTPVRFTLQSFFLVFIVGFFGASYLSSWADIFIFTILGLVCLLLHERAHVAMGAKYDIKCQGIDVMFLGAGAQLENTGKNPRQAFWIAFIGPLSSFMLGLLTFGLAIVSQGALRNIFILLASLNLLLAIFNLLPLYPLDGGRVTHSIFWSFKKDEQAGRISAAKLSKVCMIILLVLTLGGIFVGWFSLFNLIWLGIMFFNFLWPMANAELASSKLSNKKFHYGSTVYVSGTYPPLTGFVVDFVEKPEEKYVVKRIVSKGWFRKAVRETYFEYELEEW